MAKFSGLPNWSVYGNYSSENYGAHALRFDVGGNSYGAITTPDGSPWTVNAVIHGMRGLT